MNDRPNDRRDERREATLGEAIPSTEAKLTFEGDLKARAALFAAIGRAKLNFTPIINDSKGQFGNRFFKYAALDTLVACTEAALSKEGVTVMQFMTGPTMTGEHRVTTIVAGCEAEIHSIIDYARDTDMKLWGGQSTYIRRYAYRALFQLDGSDDADAATDRDDGPRRDTRPNPPQAQRPAQAPKQAPAPPAPKPEPKPVEAPKAKEEPSNDVQPEPAPAAAPSVLPPAAAFDMTDDQRNTIRREAMGRGLTRDDMNSIRLALGVGDKPTAHDATRILEAVLAREPKALV